MHDEANAMQETGFRNWLTAVRQLKEGAAAGRVADCKRVEHYEGDLEDQWAADGLDTLLKRLTYSRDDERSGRPAKHKVPIDGNVYNGTATLKAAVRRYREFRASANHTAELPEGSAVRRPDESAAQGTEGRPSSSPGCGEPGTTSTCFEVFRQCVSGGGRRRTHPVRQCSRQGVPLPELVPVSARTYADALR